MLRSSSVDQFSAFYIFHYLSNQGHFQNAKAVTVNVPPRTTQNIGITYFNTFPKVLFLTSFTYTAIKLQCHSFLVEYYIIATTPFVEISFE